MQFIRDIMPLTPDTWDKNFVYNDKRYILVEVEEDTREYKEVIDEFRKRTSSTVGFKVTIQRVQHPFAFARFMIHKEALIQKGKFFQEAIIYKRIDEGYLSIYLEYNCDQRRVQSMFDMSSLRASLFMHFALQALEGCYVQQRVITDDYFGERDSNTYPEYVIKLSQIEK